jgi:hypothetical protein
MTIEYLEELLWSLQQELDEFVADVRVFTSRKALRTWKIKH